MRETKAAKQLRELREIMLTEIPDGCEIGEELGPKPLPFPFPPQVKELPK